MKKLQTNHDKNINIFDIKITIVNKYKIFNKLYNIQ